MMYTVRKIGLVVAVLGLVAGVAAQADAGVAITFSETTGSELGNPPGTLGFQFTTNQAITVTHLGIFDSDAADGEGLAESHEVGLWNSAGDLIVSTTIGSGTAGMLIDQFRYSGVGGPQGVLLSAGTYTIGALYTSGADPLLFPGDINPDPSNFVVAPQITSTPILYVAGTSGSLDRPTLNNGTDPGFFGPNFTFEVAVAAVPEPSTIVGAGMAGLLGLGYVRLRRRAKAAA